jgi:hypothetical protein
MHPGGQVDLVGHLELPAGISMPEMPAGMFELHRQAGGAGSKRDASASCPYLRFLTCLLTQTCPLPGIMPVARNPASWPKHARWLQPACWLETCLLTPFDTRLLAETCLPARRNLPACSPKPACLRAETCWPKLPVGSKPPVGSKRTPHRGAHGPKPARPPARPLCASIQPSGFGPSQPYESCVRLLEAERARLRFDSLCCGPARFTIVVMDGRL